MLLAFLVEEMEVTMKLKENAVYSDVVDGGYILPKKDKYTMSDFKKLVKSGWNQIDARWIIICSAVYHETELSNKFGTEKFLFACSIGLAY